MTRAARTPPLEFDTLEDVVAAVRARGGRLSTARRLILERLFATDVPLTADALAVEGGLETGSVYRNLEHLEALGVVRHAHFGHGPGRYVLVARPAREYLVCDTCDTVTAVDPTRLDAVRAAIRQTFGFDAAFDHFPIAGLCADCQARGAAVTHDRHDHRN